MFAAIDQPFATETAMHQPAGLGIWAFSIENMARYGNGHDICTDDNITVSKDKAPAIFLLCEQTEM